MALKGLPVRFPLLLGLTCLAWLLPKGTGLGGHRQSTGKSPRGKKAFLRSLVAEFRASVYLLQEDLVRSRITLIMFNLLGLQELPKHIIQKPILTTSIVIQAIQVQEKK